ncbi:hypothetical protein ACFL02_05825, partial [Planctomycetota bacterium]
LKDLKNIEPTQVIIFVQALNGLILPFISIFLLFVVNDPGLMGKKALNGPILNILQGLIVWVSLVLGLYKIFDSLCKAGNFAMPRQNIALGIIMLVSLGISILIWGLIYAQRRRHFIGKISS